MDLAGRVMYIDANRLHSVSSEDNNSSWVYQLNNGMKVPAGTQISMLNAFLNYNGITGGSIEFVEDKAEEISYSFYKPQGSTFSLTAQLLYDPNTDLGDSKNKTGAFMYDAQKHRNIQNTAGIPLLKIEAGYTSTEQSEPIYFLQANLPYFDITINFANPATHWSDIKDYWPEEVYAEYYDNGIVEVVQEGAGYSGSNIAINGSVIALSITAEGLGYAVGDTLTFTGGGATEQAFGYVSEIDEGGIGFIKKVRILQVGEGYTSAPTITINTAGGAGGSVGPVMGTMQTVRTDNSGYSAVIGATWNIVGGTYTLTGYRILKAGYGYRQSDLLYVDEGKADLKFFPTNHAIPNKGTVEGILRLNYTTALDFETPGVLTLTNGEKIQYVRATQNTNSIIFIADDNEIADTVYLNTTDGTNADITGYLAATSRDQTYRRFSYKFNIPNAGSNYRGMPEITYTPAGYEEKHLNTEDGEPVFLPIMNENHQLEEVRYFGRCRDNLSAQNYIIDYELGQESHNEHVTGDATPGILGIIGGDPDTQAKAEFSTTTLSRDSIREFKRAVFPPIMNRAYQQSSTLKLNYSLVFITVRGNYQDNTNVTLLPVDEEEGTGAVVNVRTPYNYSPSVPMVAKVTSGGTGGYKVGDRYYLDNGNPTEFLAIVEVVNIDAISSDPLPAQDGPYNSVYMRPNSVTGGIAENTKNSLIQKAIFKGKSETLTNDEFFENSGIESFRDPERTLDSALPRMSYNILDNLDFDNLRTCGGTNDLLGYCEFTEEGHLIPKVQTTTIRISKGIYSVNELASIISDQLTNTDKETGFINTSAFSTLVETHEYEPALFTGKEHHKAGRGVFVSMDVFNTLMGLYKDLDPDDIIDDTYLWETFYQTNYYSFIRSFFPKSKAPISQVFTTSLRKNFSNEDYAQSTAISYDVTSIYDQLHEGILLGSTDFNFSYDDDKSTYKFEFLHCPFAVPQYDKFGNQFASPGTTGALVRKTVDNPIITGLRKQYLNSNGFTAKTPQALIDSIESPITRSTGVMVHNFSLNIAETVETLQRPQFARFKDFFDLETTAESKWIDTLFSRLGFSYAQLNADASKPVAKYYDYTNIVCYGITTDQKLDTSVTTTISTVTADRIRETSAEGQSEAQQLPYQQLFNMTLPNRPLAPVYTTQGYNYTNGKPFSRDTKSYKFFVGSVYDSSTTIFIQTDGDNLVASNLPTLIRDGYFLVSSDIVDGYKDSIKKNENIPLLGVVPKSSYQSQDFSAVLSSEIEHITSNEKVINSIKIDIYNPDLTKPTLRPDSTVMLKLIFPAPIPQDEKSIKEK